MLACFLLVAALSAKAQKMTPTWTYKLHASYEFHSSDVVSHAISLLHNGSLLVVVPGSDGKWTINRVANWTSIKPTVETLEFKAQPSEQDNGRSVDLLIDRSETYAVFRSKLGAGSWSPVAHVHPALVAVIDLRTFSVVSTKQSSDPLIALSDWAFARDGMLISNAMTGRRETKPVKPKYSWDWETITDIYKASAFQLPELKALLPCDYELFLEKATNGAPLSRVLSKASAGCSELAVHADVPSPENLPDGPPRAIPYAKLAPGCIPQGENATAAFALFYCETGHGYMDGMISFIDTRALIVVATATQKRVLELPLPHNEKQYPALLADADGSSWMITLKNGVQIEAYKL